MNIHAVVSQMGAHLPTPTFGLVSCTKSKFFLCDMVSEEIGHSHVTYACRQLYGFSIDLEVSLLRSAEFSQWSSKKMDII